MLTAAAKASARELLHAGIPLAITGGRPPRGMSMLIEPLALHGAIAGFNGGDFVNPDLSVIESHTSTPRRHAGREADPRPRTGLVGLYAR